MPEGTWGRPATAEEVVTRAQLAALLTERRARCGKSLRKLAAEVGSSASTLSGWCRAENLPFPAQDEVFAAMVRAMGVEDPDPWLAALHRVRDGSNGTTPTTSAAPYLGLRRYDADDAPRFHGRERLTERAVELLHRVDRDDAARIGFLIGASGTGKSSLLRAGIGPALRATGRAVHVIDATETDDVIAALPEAAPGRPRPVVLLDQFEQLLTGDHSEVARQRTVQRLTARSSSPDGVTVIAALRIDLYSQVASTPVLAGALEEHTLLVPPLDRAELTRVIVEPARGVGSTVDDEVVDLVLADLLPTTSLETRPDVGVLPLLSHALLEAWSQARGDRLTVRDYLGAGGLVGAVERTAEAAYDDLSDRQREVARHVLLRLVHLDDDGTMTRRAVTHAELDTLATDRAVAGADTDAPTADVRAVLDRFIAARLLTADRRTVSVAHEAMLTAWPRLRRWIAADREALPVRRRLTEATRIWRAGQHDPGLLATGPRLELFRSVDAATTGAMALTADERRFLDASREQEHASRVEDDRRRRAQRWLTGAAATSALLAGGFAVDAAWSRGEVITARDQALSRQVALTAQRLRETDPALAADLALAGYATSPTSEARSELLRSTGAPSAVRYPGGAGPTALATTAATDLVAVSDATQGEVRLATGDAADLQPRATIALPDEVEAFALAISPDGRTLAVGDTTATVTLWDVTDPDDPAPTGTPLTGLSGPVQGLAYHPDGSELAAAGDGDGVVRWEVADPTSPRALPTLPHEPITWSVTYDTTGHRLVFGDDLGQVHIRTLDGDEATVLEVGERAVVAVAVSADGGLLATGDQSATASVFELDDPSEPVELVDAEFGSWVNAVRFDEGRSRLLAGSSDGTVRAWETSGWTALGDLPHPSPVTDLQVNTDGDVLTVATDGALRSWDHHTNLGRAAAGRIFTTSFSDDGRRLASFAGPGIDLWEVTGSSPVHDRRLAPDAAGPAFSGAGALAPDGRWLAAGTMTGEVVVLALDDDDPQVLGGPSALVQGVGIDADGQRVAAVGSDETLRVWTRGEDGFPARPQTVVEGFGTLLFDVVWHPDQDVVAVAGIDGNAYLYDVGGGSHARLAALPATGGEVFSVAIDPAGEVLAAGAGDGSVALWDIRDLHDPTPLTAPLTAPVGQAYALSFSRGGDRLAAAVTDGSVWVWDLAEAEQPQRFARLGPGEAAMFATAFSPADDLLAAGGGDQRLELWPATSGDAHDLLCGRGGARVTAEEWDRYVPGTTFLAPCRDHPAR